MAQHIQDALASSVILPESMVSGACISVRRHTLRLISEMAEDMGISINEVFSFLAEDSVIDLELLEDLNEIEIPSQCSLDDLKNALLKKKLR